MSSSKTLDWLLSFSFRTLAIFMLAEAIYHVSGLRLAGVEEYWPASAVIFAKFFLTLWASASLMISVFLWKLSYTFRQFPRLLLPVAILSFIHSGVLFFFSFAHLETILPEANLYVNNPYYSWQLVAEALALDIFSGLLLLKYFAVKS